MLEEVDRFLKENLPPNSTSGCHGSHDASVVLHNCSSPQLP